MFSVKAVHDPAVGMFFEDGSHIGTSRQKRVLV
jgi:hypothetical protein